MKGTLRTLDQGRKCHSEREGGAGRLGILPRGEGTDDPLISLTLEVLRFCCTQFSPKELVEHAGSRVPTRCPDSVGLQWSPGSSLISKLRVTDAEGLQTHHQGSSLSPWSV